MDKMREEFDGWFWDYHHKDCTEDYWSAVFAIGCDGKYQGVACEGAWQGWKASRAALCIELPRAFNQHECDYKKDVVSALVDAGVSHE